MTDLEKMIVLAKAAGVLFDGGFPQASMTTLAHAVAYAMMTDNAAAAHMARVNTEYKKAGGR